MVFSEADFLGCRFDLPLLAKHVPDLPRMWRGQADARSLAHRYSSLCHLKHIPGADEEQWRQARELVIRLAISEAQSFHRIRCKLGDPGQPGTARFLSDISLWLSGELGLPVSVTKPWTAIMLAEVAQFGTWSVLRNEPS